MNIIHDIDAKEIEAAIVGLKEYVNDASIEPLIAVLEAVKQEPENESLLIKLSDTFKALGIIQGAVLTYAPYLNFILSNDLFDD